MLNIVCINADNYLGRGAEYVNILADMVGRNISKETVYKFICFTDTPDGYDPEIDVRPLPASGLEGWWNKLALFKEGLFPDGDRILYLDLDTVITGSLDEIIKYGGEFAILRDFYRPQGLQSSVMAWEAGTKSNIDLWEQWCWAKQPKSGGGDQHWIEIMVSGKKMQIDVLQDLFPDSFVSYKVHARGGIPKNAKMVIFHGQPRPHEAITGWMPHVWKIGGGTTLELQMVCNTEESDLISNIRHALKLPFPWLQLHDAHDGHAVIIGGGPSLKTGIKEIKERQRTGQTVFSTNNTYNYLAKNGIIPDMHVMVDAREKNKEFIPSSDGSIHYYASQCHPSVFEKAKDRNIVLFHCMDEGIQQYIGWDTGDPLVGGKTTVGLKSIALAWILGYRIFHLYGFDSSYEEGENHAYPQPLNDKEKVIEVIMDGKKYLTSPWMCTQVENFKEVAIELVNSGCILTIHGSGLLPDMARTMKIPTPAAHIRANEILMRLNVPNPVGVEVGVFTGALSSKLLERNDLTLYMVDSWATSSENSEYAKSGDFHAALNQVEQDKYFEAACRSVEFAGNKAKIIRKPSLDAAREIDDGSLDFVFIDADHSYEGCSKDMAAWASKIKPGGLLCGHDYNNVDYPCFGVNRAVDEFSQSSGLPMELGENFTWFIRLAA